MDGLWVTRPVATAARSGESLEPPAECVRIKRVEMRCGGARPSLGSRLLFPSPPSDRPAEPGDVGCAPAAGALRADEDCSASGRVAQVRRADRAPGGEVTRSVGMESSMWRAVIASRARGHTLRLSDCGDVWSCVVLNAILVVEWLWF
ncbi:uncharacterized protein AMSG_11803 [Thecamonas trahens ATCC 50062]|uniref:Uncharacterized protein n=1 Tax=Thecamonas trahens ATCC 50062 TaxID=461836 RepID=A0A0L0D6Y9_THETB|nr:hypothetical protein AMSG_11803 [Thecamonas trahens ATCC 50062]KNC48104.1 hypothetical protein AMSG_11803 [Thecamonas trahens ATCC 50062]|eukprot:XP_013758900.1 hypothetical protein AMSG_11803 [Thecamonas trahens ATCC 50062]